MWLLNSQKAQKDQEGAIQPTSTVRAKAKLALKPALINANIDHADFRFHNASSLVEQGSKL